jgi:predicted metal-dependent hydrolase
MADIEIDKIIRSKRRTLSLVVDSQGRLIARAPFSLPERSIINFALKKKSWIDKRKAIARKRSADLKPKVISDGTEFAYLGNTYPLKVVNRDRILISEGLEFPEQLLPAGHQALRRWYKKEARRVIEERLNFYSRLMNFIPKGMRISNALSRWGSCGRNNSLNFTWRLVMAPLEVIDYVVVHELAHIKEKNHSAKFWALVARYFPDYRRKRAWLKNYGYKLMV